ncbi:MAG: ATP-binding cassette domain-containing protein [Alphaproteobacteria bacterium]|nr:MAG: ATP-binding cassette domain-containing protein [Alphaproteobacteria bacterium]
MHTIDVRELRKAFAAPKKKGGTEMVAVDGLSFAISPGEKVAFIGPNGAGKSTTLKMLCGILHPSSGEALVAGFVPWKQTRALAHKLGIVFGQRSQLWPSLPVRDSFDMLAAIYSLEGSIARQRRDRLVDIFGIVDLLGQTARSLSLGQRMRCDIVASLLHGPDILFLDEPTIGLDVTAKALLRDHLNDLAEQDSTTIILTSHDTGDIEHICRRVILIDHGRKVVDEDLGELRRSFMGRKILRLVTDEESPQSPVSEAEIAQSGPHSLTLVVDTARLPVDRAVAACLANLSVKDLTIEDPPLEDVIKRIYAQQGRGA